MSETSGFKLPKGQHFIGESRVISEIKTLVVECSNQEGPVLILGETGTGKELIANALHYSGIREKKPFQPVVVPGNSLVESEMFGHTKGAFTSAINAREGYFESAGSGSIFIDEIGELEERIQVKLLRVIQEREVLPLGSSTRKQVECRIIAATSRNESSKDSKIYGLRPDLYYRFKHVIKLPAIKNRFIDLLLLYIYFYKNRFGINPQMIPFKHLADLYLYEWPGNVRELENSIANLPLYSNSDKCRSYCIGGLIHREEEIYGKFKQVKNNYDPPIEKGQLEEEDFWMKVFFSSIELRKALKICEKMKNHIYSDASILLMMFWSELVLLNISCIGEVISKKTSIKECAKDINIESLLNEAEEYRFTIFDEPMIREIQDSEKEERDIIVSLNWKVQLINSVLRYFEEDERLLSVVDRIGQLLRRIINPLDQIDNTKMNSDQNKKSENSDSDVLLKYNQKVEKYKEKLIMEAFEKNNRNASKTAVNLDINRNTVSKYVKKANHQ